MRIFAILFAVILAVGCQIIEGSDGAESGVCTWQTTNLNIDAENPTLIEEMTLDGRGRIEKITVTDLAISERPTLIKTFEYDQHRLIRVVTTNLTVSDEPYLYEESEGTCTVDSYLLRRQLTQP